MGYEIFYSCVCHIGKRRKINQDNFICDNQYIQTNDTKLIFPLRGVKSSDEGAVFGIFDGMGGEECGEVASYLAAKRASTLKITEDPVKDLSKFCQQANEDICQYISESGIFSMGTTAAILAFTRKAVTLCNIGDSKIFRLCDGVLEQISQDHVAISAFGVKPPLSQNLGIPPSELIIDPYFAKGAYNHGDVYLICSDGLTDMVSVDEISQVLVSKPIDEAIAELLDKALSNGGKDNTTIILCKIEREPGRFFNWKRYIKEMRGRKDVG